jgi:hypothetical protein
MSVSLGRRTPLAWLLSSAMLLACPPPASAQQSVSDVLSFLLTNRSIPTEDFVRDEQAAAATADSVSRFLLIELATLPIGSSAGGFTYRLDPALGTVIRSSDSFGPFFTERALTAGRRQSSFAVSYQAASFDTIDGRSLRDGTLVSTASRIRGDASAFDVETLTLRIRANTLTFALNHGITDRLDVSAVVPFVRLTLTGERLDTYRGTALLQAAGSAAASGLGDVLVRTKYNVIRRGGSGVAVGGEARLPTGDRANLLGGGEFAFRPRLIGSAETTYVGVHGEVGYSLGGLSQELDFAGAVAAAALPNLTVIGELAGRRLDSVSRLAELTEPHPRLSGVDTIRLTGVPQAMTRLVAMGGIKWNVAGTVLLSASVMRPINDAGLNARWVPTVTVDYSFGR